MLLLTRCSNVAAVGVEVVVVKVVFKAECEVKEGRKWVKKSFEFTETHKTEADARLRALALNWHIVSVEVSQ